MSWTPLLPPERQRDAHLIAATVMAIVSREAAGEGRQWESARLLSEFYVEAGGA